MAEDASFRDLLERVRARDEQAAAELVRRFEPAIRVAVRVRLTDPRLRRQFDSMDICQSVLANFFVRAASGQFELERSEQLVNLLVTMARNRLINEAAKHRAARRDQRRVQAGEVDQAALADSEPTPSVVVANRELLDEARNRLTEEERRIADQRALGRAWADIAAETREKPDALRMRFARALDRIAQELGLEE
jgi:RNA polymerase sigma-70 factor (ECF subfamily)